MRTTASFPIAFALAFLLPTFAVGQELPVTYPPHFLTFVENQMEEKGGTGVRWTGEDTFRLEVEDERIVRGGTERDVRHFRVEIWETKR